jgi:hypothetical protein
MRRDLKIAAAIAAAVTGGLLLCRVPGMGSDCDAWSYAALGIMSRKVGYFPSRLVFPPYPTYEYLAIALNRLHLPATTLVALAIASSAVCAVLLWRILEHYKVGAAWLLAPAVILSPAWAVGGSQAMEYSLAMALLLGAWLAALRSAQDVPAGAGQGDPEGHRGAALRGSRWTGVLFGLAVATRWTSLAAFPLFWLEARQQRWRSMLWSAGIIAAAYVPSIFLWRWRHGFPLFYHTSAGAALTLQSAVGALGILGLPALIIVLLARPRVPAWPLAAAAALSLALFFAAPYEPQYLIVALPFLVLLAAYHRPAWVSVALAALLLAGTPSAVAQNRAENYVQSAAVAGLLDAKGYQILPLYLHGRVIVLTDGTLRTHSARFLWVSDYRLPALGLIRKEDAQQYRDRNRRRQPRPASRDHG